MTTCFVLFVAMSFPGELTESGPAKRGFENTTTVKKNGTTSKCAIHLVFM